MLYSRFKLPALTLAAFFSLSPTANADVIAPALEIDDSGAGDFISRVGDSLTIDGTGTSIITDFGPPLAFVDIADVDFLLTATYDSNNGTDYFFTNGTVNAGPYLNTTFNSLAMSVDPFGLTATFTADFTNGGSILGSFFITGSLDSDFTGDVLIAKAGPVVPIPAAVWLFGSGLLGLVAVARRRRIASA